VAAVTMLIDLWSYYSYSVELVAISFLYIITIINVLVSLAIYSLLLIDNYSSINLEKLDDYVYYINLFGNVVILEILNIYL